MATEAGNSKVEAGTSFGAVFEPFLHKRPSVRLRQIITPARRSSKLCIKGNVPVCSALLSRSWRPVQRRASSSAFVRSLQKTTLDLGTPDLHPGWVWWPDVTPLDASVLRARQRQRRGSCHNVNNSQGCCCVWHLQRKPALATVAASKGTAETWLPARAAWRSSYVKD